MKEGASPPAADPELEALARRYFASLSAAVEHSVPRRDTGVGGATAWSANHRMPRMILASVTVAAVLGAAVAVVAVTHVAPSGRRSVADLRGAAATPAPTLCSVASRPSFPPSLTPDQLAQAIQRADAWGAACEVAWWKALDVSNVDWATLPHVSVAADYAPPDYSSLKASANAADTIIRATVSSVVKTDHQGIGFSLSVQQVIKGTTGTSGLTLVGESQVGESFGSPMKGRGYPSPVIQDDPGTAFPLPGQELIVFGHLVGTQLQAQSWTGTYFVDAGVITPLPANPFAQQIRGVSLSAFVAAIQAA